MKFPFIKRVASRTHAVATAGAPRMAMQIGLPLSATAAKPMLKGDERVHSG